MGLSIPPGNHRKHASFLALDRALPAASGAVRANASPQFSTIEIGLISVIGILDENVLLAQGQGVDEAVGAILVEIRVHYNRRALTVRCQGVNAMAHK